MPRPFESSTGVLVIVYNQRSRTFNIRVNLYPWTVLLVYTAYFSPPKASGDNHRRRKYHGKNLGFRIHGIVHIYVRVTVLFIKTHSAFRILSEVFFKHDSSSSFQTPFVLVDDPAGVPGTTLIMKDKTKLAVSTAWVDGIPSPWDFKREDRATSIQPAARKI